MKLSAIKGKNYKGGPFEYYLSGCDLFTGENAIGKSRIRETCDLAMRGEIAGSETKRIDLVHFNYATDREKNIAAQVRIQNGETEEAVTRFIGPNKKGVITQAIKFRGKEYGRVKGNEAITKLINPCIEAIDFEKFSGLTDDPTKVNSKVKYLLGLTGEPEGITRESIHEQILKSNGDPLTDSWREVCNNIFEVWPGDDTIGVRNGIISLSEQVQSKLHEAYKEARDAATVEENLADMEKAEELLAGDVVTAKRKLEEARKREKELNNEKTNAKNKGDEYERWTKTKAKLEAGINVATQNLKGVQRGNTHQYVKMITDLEAAIHTDETYEQLKKELAALEGKLPDIETLRDDAVNKVNEIKDGIIATSEKTIEVFSEDKVQCPAVPGMGCRVTQKQKDEIIAQAQDDFATGTDALVDAEPELERRDAEYTEVVAKINELTDIITSHEDEDVETRNKIKVVEEKRSGHAEHVDLLVTGLAEARERLRTHANAEPHIKGVADQKALQDELTGIEGLIPKLEQDYDAKTQEKGRKIAAIESERKRLLAGGRIENLKALKDTIGSILTDILSKTLAPVESLINQCLPDKHQIVAGIDPDKPFGVMKDGEYRALGALSGGEWAIVVAAIATVFMNFKGTKLRILMCELGEVDKDNVIQLVKSMAKAVELGILDNFIGFKSLAKSEPAYPDIPGAEIWRLEGAA